MNQKKPSETRSENREHIKPPRKILKRAVRTYLCGFGGDVSVGDWLIWRGISVSPERNMRFFRNVTSLRKMSPPTEL